MAVLSRSVYVLAAIDAVIITLCSFICYGGIVRYTGSLFIITLLFVASILFILALKGFYRLRKYQPLDLYTMFEGVFVGSFLATLVTVGSLGLITIYLTLFNLIFIYTGLVATRLLYLLYKKFIRKNKNHKVFARKSISRTFCDFCFCV